MSVTKCNKLESKLKRLELLALDSMKDSVVDFFQRVPSGTKSKPRWTPEMYPTGSEKELYAEIAYILLSYPDVMIPSLLKQFQTSVAHHLRRTPLLGNWRAYRISTVRVERGIKCTGPMCFPGAAGSGGIADVGLFLNPSYHGANGRQVKAERILYFEIKSADHHLHKPSQLQAHLKALKLETPDEVGFLATIGGKSVNIQHPRWLGHITLDDFLQKMNQTATDELQNSRLAVEIKSLHLRKNQTKEAKGDGG